MRKWRNYLVNGSDGFFWNEREEFWLGGGERRACSFFSSFWLRFFSFGAAYYDLYQSSAGCLLGLIFMVVFRSLYILRRLTANQELMLTRRTRLFN